MAKGMNGAWNRARSRFWASVACLMTLLIEPGFSQNANPAEKNGYSENLSPAVDLVASLVEQWSGLERTLRTAITELQAKNAVLEGTVESLQQQVIELRFELQKEAREKDLLQSELQDSQRQASVASALKKESDQLRDRLEEVTAALARSNRAAERYREQYREAELRRQTLALAIESGRGVQELQSQLVTALELLNRERIRSERLGSLLSRIDRTSTGPELAREIELALSRAPAEDGEPDIDGAPTMTVLSYSPELGLIGIQGGRDRGLVLGALVAVERDGQTVSRARVVDLREHVAGALLEPEDGKGQEPRVGDVIRIQ
jgi:uncharacterized coiled-coil protein SlyX